MTDSDSELLERCRRADQAAWYELVARHTRRIFSLAYRFTGRVDEAEDLTQEVFVKVYEGLHRYQPSEGAFATWLTAVARNHAIDHYRRRREERLRATSDPQVLEGMASAQETQQHSLEREERAQLVRRGLAALPPDLREAVVLCDLHEMPYEEIARIAGVPLGTIKSRINRGRLELARRLLGRLRSPA